MNRSKDRIMERLEHGLLSGKISRRQFVTTALATGLLAATTIHALADELEDIREKQKGWHSGRQDRWQHPSDRSR
jgi:choline dehydrogenase